MEKDTYLDIKNKIEKGEMVPFYILKDYLNYKMENNIEAEKLIHFYRINDSISYNYLKNIDIRNRYDYFIKKFNELKFSLSQEHIKEISKLLNSNDYNKEKEFILSEPNKMFLNIFQKIKDIIESQKDIKVTRDALSNLLIKLNSIYCNINKMVLFPILIASENYCYNKLIFDFIYCLEQFLRKRKTIVEYNKSSDESEEVKDQENNTLNSDENKIKKKSGILFNVINTESIETNLLNKKRKRSKSSESENNEKDYEQYDNDNEFIRSFIKLVEFLNIFEKLFKKISEKKNDSENILRIQIFLFYLYGYEEKRESYDRNILNNICNTLITSTINEEILDKFELYNKTGTKITKKDWNNIKFDEMVNIKIDGKMIENIKIKFFNSKILDVKNIYLEDILKEYNDDYLTIHGFRMKSFLFQSPEIENIIKEYLFNLLKSNIIKEGFQIFDQRFDHNKQVYPFQGIFNKEIFNEIWRNIIIIPFIYQDSCSQSERVDYKIFIDSMPKYEQNILKKINIIFTKLNDLYHEIIHIIAILYAANIKEYEVDKFSTSDSLNENLSNKINDIIVKYECKYPYEMKIDYSLADMGDIMEVYLFGIKPGQFTFYMSIYLSYILDNNRIDKINIDEIRTKLLELSSSNLEIKINRKNEIKDTFSKDKNDSENQIYQYFINNKIYKIFEDLFSKMKVITNVKYKRRLINNNYNIITNITYERPRGRCFLKKKKKYRK